MSIGILFIRMVFDKIMFIQNKNKTTINRFGDKKSNCHLSLTLCRLQKAYAVDHSYKYPMLIWDMLPHGGASQIHPHVHNFLDRTRYQGKSSIVRSTNMFITSWIEPYIKVNHLKSDPSTCL